MLRLDTFLPYRLNVLAKRVSHELARRYRSRFGITIPEWRVLAILGQEQPLSSNDIVERSQMDKAKVSRAVAGLVARGVLAKATHPDDQRLLRLSFTHEGERLFQDVAPVALAWEAELLDGLPEGDAPTLHRLIDRLESRLDVLAKLE